VTGSTSRSDPTAQHHTPRTALLVGATGLVGGHCLELLAADPGYSRVILLVRRAIARALPAKVEQHVVDFDKLDALPVSVRAEHVFCALGTTIKQAGSPEAFRKVDLDYPVNVGRLMLERGSEHFIVVSSLGANPRARVLYSRVKGEMEQAILKLPFRAITILRPSLLLGDRKEFRLGEEVAKRVGFLLMGSFKPIEARRVAQAMIAVARENRMATRIIESVEIARMTATS
jgi:uncharacterized protein YbjT (DUF2867 family)